MRSAVKTAKRVPARSASTVGRSWVNIWDRLASTTTASRVGADLPRLNAYPRSSDAPRLSSTHAGAPIAMGPVRHARLDPWDPAAPHRPLRRFVTTESCSGVEPYPSLLGLRFRRWPGAIPHAAFADHPRRPQSFGGTDSMSVRPSSCRSVVTRRPISGHEQTEYGVFLAFRCVL
jgi:hypothetical protein